MTKKTIGYLCLALVLCFVFTSVCYSADTVSGAEKAKKAGRAVFNYPANVAKKSAKIVADTGTKGTEIVAKEVKRTGEVVTGDVKKTKEMVTEPLTGSAETVVKTVEDTGKMPFEAAKEE